MFKRTFWFTTGATAGFGGAMWVRRQVLRTVRRYTPEQVQAEVTTSVRRLGTDLRSAVSEARSTMAEREAELRSELKPGSRDAGPDGDRRGHAGPDGDRRGHAGPDGDRRGHAGTDPGRSTTSPLG